MHMFLLYLQYSLHNICRKMDTSGDNLLSEEEFMRVICLQVVNIFHGNPRITYRTRALVQ
jgi:hypothetical protein